MHLGPRQRANAWLPVCSPLDAASLWQSCRWLSGKLTTRGWPSIEEGSGGAPFSSQGSPGHTHPKLCFLHGSFPGFLHEGFWGSGLHALLHLFWKTLSSSILGLSRRRIKAHQTQPRLTQPAASSTAPSWVADGHLCAVAGQSPSPCPTPAPPASSALANGPSPFGQLRPNTSLYVTFLTSRVQPVPQAHSSTIQLTLSHTHYLSATLPVQSPSPPVTAAAPKLGSAVSPHPVASVRVLYHIGVQRCL